jgi:hypothetical protein
MPDFYSDTHVVGFMLRTSNSWHLELCSTEYDSEVNFICFHGSNRLGSLGNNDARLMLFNFKNSIATRSNPIPPPP